MKLVYQKVDRPAAKPEQQAKTWSKSTFPHVSPKIARICQT